MLALRLDWTTHSRALDLTLMAIGIEGREVNMGR
jgi:hypothetical protein